MNHLLPLQQFKEQFSYEPHILNEQLESYDHFVVIGMGGSMTCAFLLKAMFPEISLTVHSDYGLPPEAHRHDSHTRTLFICNSYSGNTEETLDACQELIWKKLPLAIVTCGGALAEQAVSNTVQHILLPKTELEPRFAIGYQMIAMLALMKNSKALHSLKSQASYIDNRPADELGKRLSNELHDRSIIMYTSARNHALAYMVKAALNEGAKVPAFCNVFSEANHNELEIFAHMQASQKNEYVVLFFEDKKDHKRIQDRMSICTDMFKEMRIKTAHFPIQSETVQSTLTSLLAGYYTSTYLALLKHAEPYKTPCIGKFKELLSKKK